MASSGISIGTGVSANSPTFSGVPQWKAVIAGDSMNDLYNITATNSGTFSATYDSSTRTIVGTDSAAHKIATGFQVAIWSANPSYPSLKYQQYFTVTRIDNTTWSVVLPSNPADLPQNGTPTAISTAGGSLFCKYPNRISAQSWIANTNALMGQPFDIIFNGAQSGDTSEGVLARLDRDVLNYNPQVVLMQSPGINDRSSSFNISLTDTLSNLQQIYDKIVASGAILVLGTLTPVATGEARATKPNMAAIIAINKFIRAYSRKNKNVILLDFWRQIVNSLDATGLATSGLLKASDNIHYNNSGAYLVAKYAKTILQSFFGTAYESRVYSVLDCFAGTGLTVTNATSSSTGGTATVTSGSAHGYRVGDQVGIQGLTGASAAANGWWTILTVPTTTSFTFYTGGADTGTFAGTGTISQIKNLFNNPLLQTTGGTAQFGVSGAASDVALGLVVTNTQGAAGGLTAVGTLQNHPSGASYGKVQQIAITACGTADTPGIQTQGVTSYFVNQMAVGRQYQFEIELIISSTGWGTTPIAEIVANMTVQMDSSYTFVISAFENFDAGVAYIAENQTFRLRSPKFTLPAGTLSQAYFNCWIRPSAALSVGTLTCQWQPQWVEQTSP